MSSVQTKSVIKYRKNKSQLDKQTVETIQTNVVSENGRFRNQKNESSSPEKGADDHCVVCGLDWKNRKPTTYADLGSKSISFVSGYQLLSKFGRQKIKLTLCDLHGNNLRSCTRITNKGVLKILNKLTGKWRNATSVGVLV